MIAAKKMLLVGGLVLDPDAKALIARMDVKPGRQRASLINDTIKAIKQSGVWTKLAALYVMAAANQQAALLDWKNAQRRAVLRAGSPIFRANVGFQDGGFDHSDNGGAVSPVNARGMFLWGDGGSTSYIMGYADDSGNRFWLRHNGTGMGGSGQSNGFASGPFQNAGLKIGQNDGVVVESFHNGSLAGSGSGGRVYSWSEIAYERLNSTPRIASERVRIAGSFVSRLTAAEVTAFYNALNNYISKIGSTP